jgi:hypothetical protein
MATKKNITSKQASTAKQPFSCTPAQQATALRFVNPADAESIEKERSCGMKTVNAARQERDESPVLKQDIKPLTPGDHRKARDAFNALLDAPDDDKHALAAEVTVQSLIRHRKKQREELRFLKGGRHGR